MQNITLTDHRDPRFADAFMRYFAELGICVRDWSGLWDEMNRSGVSTLLRICNGDTVGFIQYEVSVSKSAFFEERIGFVRELWVAPAARRGGHGAALLSLAEEACRAEGIGRILLTTDTAEAFYLRRGYCPRPDVSAANRLPVLEKRLI